MFLYIIKFGHLQVPTYSWLPPPKSMKQISKYQYQRLSENSSSHPPDPVPDLISSPQEFCDSELVLQQEPSSALPLDCHIASPLGEMGTSAARCRRCGLRSGGGLEGECCCARSSDGVPAALSISVPPLCFVCLDAPADAVLIECSHGGLCSGGPAVHVCVCVCVRAWTHAIMRMRKRVCVCASVQPFDNPPSLHRVTRKVASSLPSVFPIPAAAPSPNATTARSYRIG